MSKKKVLCVGLVCLDIISVCDGFPKEDSDQRCLEQRWQRGGNASNTATVLSILGCQAEYAGTIANSHEKSFILNDFKKYGIASKASYCEGCSCPTSVVLVNGRSGSRTIVHGNRNLPEYTVDKFVEIDLTAEGFSWIHFEGRSTVNEILQMIQVVSRHSLEKTSGRIRTSVEIEKKRRDLDKLFGVTDVTFISKDYAEYCGKKTKEEAVLSFVKLCKPGAIVVCAWGEDGAAAMVNTEQSALVSVPAHPPARVVDTLGAGDTFIAACIHALTADRGLETALQFACRVAGQKCGVNGFEGLRLCDVTI